MAAGYQTGTASSPNDLLQKLVTWLVSTQGWTQNMSQADGTGWRAHVSKGGIYVNMRATPGNESSNLIWSQGMSTPIVGNIGIALYTGSGYSGASAWYAQAGGPIGSGQTYTVGSFMQTPSGAMTAYHFFDDGSDNIVVVVERTSGIFTNMGWGPSLTKAGTWTGGAYFFAALGGAHGGTTNSSIPGSASISANCPMTFGDSNGCSPGFICADVDSFTGKWLCMLTATGASFGYTGKIAASGIVTTGVTLPAEIPQYGATLFSRLVSSINSQAILMPVRIFAERDLGGFSLLGDVPNIFLSNGVGNGFANAAIYQIGSENYMLFPKFAVRKWA